MDTRAPERLVDVDVPEAGERPLVEESRLDRRLSIREPCRERLRRERPPQRLAPETRAQVRIELARLDEEPRAEASDVAVNDFGPVVELHDRAPMRDVPGRRMENVPRHPQVDQEDAPALELDDEILATPIDGGDALAGQFGS